METAPAKTAEKFTKEEIESGKGMGVLAYIGILCLIPFFAEKKNKFVIYHAKQGLNLFLFGVIIGVGLGIISSVLVGITTASFNIGLLIAVGTITSILGWVIGIFFLVMMILGIVQVCGGEAKELPVVGKIKFIK